MKNKKFILDFDGTLTDIKKETEFFQEYYPLIFLNNLGFNPKANLAEFEKIKKALINSEKGFILGGFDVLPISSDPYILTQGASQEFLKIHNIKVNDETKLMIDLYSETISKKPKEDIPFREGKDRTKKFLEFLLNLGQIAIVTNSKEEKIINALDSLGKEYATEISVYGGAKKLYIDNEFKQIRCSTKIPESEREILLRRKNYFEILKRLQEKGFTSKKTTVIGDIYELDLSLPHYLNYGIIQIENGYSRLCERNYLKERFVQNYDDLEKIISNKI